MAELQTIYDDPTKLEQDPTTNRLIEIKNGNSCIRYRIKDPMGRFD